MMRDEYQYHLIPDEILSSKHMSLPVHRVCPSILDENSVAPKQAWGGGVVNACLSSFLVEKPSFP